MRNENGFATLIALFMMLMLAMTIMSVTNLAARQSQIYNNSRQELKLQNAAESAFNEVAAHLMNNDKYYGEYENNLKNLNLIINDISVKIFLRKIERTKNNFPEDTKSTHVYIILIRSLAEMSNDNYPSYKVYKRVYGYMSRAEIVDNNGHIIDGAGSKYEFNEYLE